MDFNATFAISAAGMSAERTRVDVAALNLANASTAHAAGEAGFVPMRAVLRSNAPAFAAAMSSAAGAAGALPLPTVTLEPSGRPERKIHDPGHPLADAAGFVRLPGVDAATEMVTMMSATRAYEANVAVMNTARMLAQKALEIGGNQ
jgi:flagellar basal-body rod protein FlgC